jgi:hypothetical protein
MSEWNNIEGLEAWTKKLGELLAEAKGIAQNNDPEELLAMNDRLIQFIVHSYPNTPAIKELDEMASQAADALLLDSIDKRLAAISQRTAMYAKVSKELKSATETNKAKAESIRLKGATALIDSATKTIEAAKELKGALTSKAADQKLGEKIDLAVSAVEDLRKSAAKVF